MTVSRHPPCPRCGSAAVFSETDSYGTYISCINCGWGKYLDSSWSAKPEKGRGGFHISKKP